MNEEKVIVIDFGGQYNQLVARRVRECNVYCEIYSYRTGTLRELFLQVDLTAVMNRIHHHIPGNCLSWESLYLDFAMAHSL